MNQPELGKKILELRQNKGLTQSELAEHCNLSLRTVQRIESGEATPRGYTIKAIFSYLGYDLNNSSTDLSDNQSGKDHVTNNWLEQLLKHVLELFNLKRNTMTKVSVLTLVAILVTGGLFLTKNELKAQGKIEGWFLAGSNPKCYIIGLDKSIYKTGESSAFLASKCDSINGFGTLMQTCSANEYLGKRVKMTGWIKSKDVVNWVGMWMRVDSKESNKVLSFDNMQDRPIKGTNDWTKCEIVLDVPDDSGSLNFGVLLDGTGKVWFDDITFEIVDKQTTMQTGQAGGNYINKKPTNLDFSK